MTGRGNEEKGHIEPAGKLNARLSAFQGPHASYWMHFITTRGHGGLALPYLSFFRWRNRHVLSWQQPQHLYPNGFAAYRRRWPGIPCSDDGGALRGEPAGDSHGSIQNRPPRSQTQPGGCKTSEQMHSFRLRGDGRLWRMMDRLGGRRET